MRHAVLKGFITVAMVAGVSSRPAVAQAVERVDTLRWMSGCWLATRGGIVTEEMWMAPRGGVMLGVARTVNGTKLRDAEFSRIFATGDTLVYAAGPMSQAGQQFFSKRIGSREIVFENLAHDFPKRIVYKAAPPDSLIAYIEGATEGEKRIWYRFRRTTCF